MSKHIQLLKPYSGKLFSYPAGTVIGVRDKLAAELIAAKAAIEVPDDVRSLRYPPAAKLQAECFSSDDDKETAPKNSEIS